MKEYTAEFSEVTKEFALRSEKIKIQVAPQKKEYSELQGRQIINDIKRGLSEPLNDITYEHTFPFSSVGRYDSYEDQEDLNKEIEVITGKIEQLKFD